MLPFGKSQVQRLVHADWKMFYFACSRQSNGAAKCTHDIHGNIAGLQTCDLHALHPSVMRAMAHKCTHKFHGNGKMGDDCNYIA